MTVGWIVLLFCIQQDAQSSKTGTTWANGLTQCHGMVQSLRSVATIVEAVSIDNRPSPARELRSETRIP